MTELYILIALWCGVPSGSTWDKSFKSPWSNSASQSAEFVRIAACRERLMKCMGDKLNKKCLEQNNLGGLPNG